VRNARLWHALFGVVKTIVEAVEFDEDAQVLVGRVRPARAAALRCGVCQRRCGRYDSGEGRHRTRRTQLPINRCSNPLVMPATGPGSRCCRAKSFKPDTNPCWPLSNWQPNCRCWGKFQGLSRINNALCEHVGPASFQFLRAGVDLSQDAVHCAEVAIYRARRRSTNAGTALRRHACRFRRGAQVIRWLTPRPARIVVAVRPISALSGSRGGALRLPGFPLPPRCGFRCLRR
jgi:hypothetical protein